MLAAFSQLRDRANLQLRRTAMLSFGAVLMAIGGGFIAAAAWIGLAPLMGAVGASLALGAVFVVAGAIAIGLRGTRPAPAMDAGMQRMSGADGLFRPGGDFPPVMEAFLFGVAVYLQMRNRRR